MPQIPDYLGSDEPDAFQDTETTRRNLRAKVAAERAYFLNLMRQEPEGFLTLLPILTGDDPQTMLLSLEPEVTNIIFQLAAMACADIVAEGAADDDWTRSN